MPRACPVESYDRRYTASLKQKKLDATALGRGGFTFPATVAASVKLHGASPWHPVLRFKECGIAEIVKLHGTSPWHPILRFKECGVAEIVKLHGASPWHPVLELKDVE